MFDLGPIKTAIDGKFAGLNHWVSYTPMDLSPNGSGFTLQVPGGALRFDHNAFGKRITYVQSGTDRIYTTPAQLGECIDAIGRFSWSEHRDVTDHDVWRHVYGYMPTFDFPTAAVNSLGQMVVGAPVQAEAVPCSKCGMVLPLFAIEVDHRFPKVGDSYMAARKVFRAIGLTATGPTGRKGLHMQAVIFNQTVPNTTIRTPHPYQARTDKFDAIGKATPSELGDMLLRTISVLDPAMQKKFLKACMNSFVNLQPMCRSCNGGKSNQWAPLFSGY
jgi:hypothetical protein